MMRRSELREHIFKLLFLTDFHPGNEQEEQTAWYLENLEEASQEDTEYIRRKYALIMQNLPEIDSQLNAVSEGWKTKRMNRVDLMLLRLALYEMKMDPAVPTGVAINEAVELAKRYGTGESGSFVNGILGSLARGLEPDRKNE